MTLQDKTIVESKSGKLHGVREDGLCVFKGIPYATPPVGPVFHTVPWYESVK